MKKIFKDKSILITGATGSIGSAIVMDIIKHDNCKVIRAMSNDENGLHELLENIDTNLNSFNLKDRMEKKKFRLLYGDIRDYSRCLQATKDVDIVIHAAAMKHISICEYNPKEAVKTNINGTKNILNASIKNNVSKFILISTDKAVNPMSDMGLTKFEAENIVLKKKNLDSKKIKISCVRFGNVLGSRGSVIPRFINQIKKNQKISLSSKNMSRFVMTIKDAVKLIFKSLSLMKGKEIFIFKSMYSIKIIDLAKALKEYYKGRFKNISIREIGIETKEKLSETLMTKRELKIAKEERDMFIIDFKKNSKNRFFKNKKNFKNIDSKNAKYLNQKQILALLKKNNLIT